MCAIKQLTTNIICCLIIISSVVCADWVFDDEGCLLPDGKSGDCKNIYLCDPMMNFLRRINNDISPDISESLSRYYCGVDGRTVKVCCPYEPIVIPRVDIDNPPPTEDIDKTKLLPSNCGTFLTQDNIVGGTRTLLYEYPWMALIGYEDGDEISFKCAGTIINNYYILTAAHCLQNSDRPVVVRLGEHNLKTDIDCDTYFGNRKVCAPPVQNIEIAEIIPHPQFDVDLRNNDIGLIRLVSPIDTTTDSSKPICLPISRQSKERQYINENFIVAGWGITENLRQSSELLKVAIPIIPITNCTNTYRLLKVNIHEDKQFCVGGQLKKDSCNGDSGGPLQNIFVDNGNVQFVQYGVVSYGPKFCGRGLPGIYTRVDYYIDWILSKLKP